MLQSMRGMIESLRIITRKNSERVAQFCFEYAKKYGRKKVTTVHNSSLMYVPIMPTVLRTINMTHSRFTFEQGSSTRGPRANCGPPVSFLWSGKAISQNSSVKLQSKFSSINRSALPKGRSFTANSAFSTLQSSQPSFSYLHSVHLS